MNGGTISAVPLAALQAHLLVVFAAHPQVRALDDAAPLDFLQCKLAEGAVRDSMKCAGN